jgi:hypothetical protein
VTMRTTGRLKLLCTLTLAVLFAISAAPTLPAQAAKQVAEEQSCVLFVQQFYDWYLIRTGPNGKPRPANRSLDDVLRLKPKLLSAELLALLKDDLAASKASSDDIVGLDWDPFLASQDAVSRFHVDAATILNGRCSARVSGVEGGKKREKVVPELASTSGNWIFVNFHYPGQNGADENLIDTLKLLRDERKKAVR